MSGVRVSPPQPFFKGIMKELENIYNLEKSDHKLVMDLGEIFMERSLRYFEKSGPIPSCSGVIHLQGKAKLEPEFYYQLAFFLLKLSRESVDNLPKDIDMHSWKTLIAIICGSDVEKIM